MTKVLNISFELNFKKNSLCHAIFISAQLWVQFNTLPVIKKM